MLDGGGDDVLFAGDGNDFLFGYLGDDLLRGGDGNDRIGFPFSDEGTILEEEGDDELFGGQEDDLLDGGPGIDLTDGQQNFDTCQNGALNRSCEFDGVEAPVLLRLRAGFGSVTGGPGASRPPRAHISRSGQRWPRPTARSARRQPPNTSKRTIRPSRKESRWPSFCSRCSSLARPMPDSRASTSTWSPRSISSSGWLRHSLKASSSCPHRSRTASGPRIRRPRRTGRRTRTRCPDRRAPARCLSLFR